MLTGSVYHVLNRSAKKARLFESDEEYHDFQELLFEARKRHPVRILAYCLMPNHWHLLLWPKNEEDLSKFVHWLSATHANRWNRARNNIGGGAVYQARFKSIPVQDGRYLYWVWRYIERNALRANLVNRAEDWHWASLRYRAKCGNNLDAGPCCLPEDWTELVNLPQTEAELAAFRNCVSRMEPYGEKDWFPTSNPRRGRPRGFTKNVKRGSDPNL